MKRRKFFQVASLSAAGLALIASCVDSKKGNNKSGIATGENSQPGTVPGYRKTIKPVFARGKTKNVNETVIVALIGAGNYGTDLIKEVANLNKNVRVKYVCDVDDTRGGWIINELEKIQAFRPIRVKDMRNVFDDKEVDAVFIETPEHWHGLAMIRACQAGKDVYVEKCISKNITEGQKMIEAAMKYERIVQCGTQNRSSDYGFTARDYIKSGELGEVIAVHTMELLDGPVPFIEKESSEPPDTIDWDMWLGPAPKVPYSISRNKSWGYYWDYSGGRALSSGVIHQLDFARLVLGDPGFPKSVYCAGGRYLFKDKRDVPDYQMTTFEYDNFVFTVQTGEFTPYLAKTSDAIRYGRKGFPEWKQNSTKIEIYGTKRMMYLGVMGGGWQVFEKGIDDDNGCKLVKQEIGYYPRVAHTSNFIDCIRSRNQPNGNIIQGHNSAALAHLANLSYRSGHKQLIVSPESETILNDSKAQELSMPHYRKGYELPDKV
jgi:predicted dehydrogenase